MSSDPRNSVLMSFDTPLERMPLTVTGFQVGTESWPIPGILVIANGQCRAFENRCPHAGHRLDFPPGRYLSADQQWLQCRSHGALFDLNSGECVDGPCVGERLTEIPIKVTETQVTILSTES
jgi:nitrite reductase/ring-hydroxylating ferredoxin subunit